jgi:hypothetical protein
MSRPYIKNGTPVGSESLCRTCARALIIDGYRESEQITVCCYVEPNLALPFTVCECTGYYDKNRPTWQQMEKLAIKIATGPIKPVGFKVGVGFHEAAAVRTSVDPDDDDDDDQDFDEEDD